jgi:hypothetical protein
VDLDTRIKRQELRLRQLPGSVKRRSSQRKETA